MVGGSNRQHEIEPILQTVAASPELSIFFDRLWDPGRHYWKLLFSHKEVLLTPLPVRDKFLPILAWASPNYLEQTAVELAKPLETTVDLSKAKRDILVERFTSPAIELAQHARDIMLFYLVKFVRANPTIQRLIRGRDFTFGRMKRVLGDFSNIDTHVLEELAPFWEAGEHMAVLDLQPSELPTADSELVSSVTKLAGLIGSLLANPEMIMEIPHELRWQTMLPVHSGLSQWMLNSLQSMGLDRDDYSAVLSDMFTLELVDTFHGAFWCPNTVHRPFVLASTSRIPPSWYDVKCVSCNETLVTSVLYRLHTVIFDAIQFKDGLLAVAVAQLLRRNRATYVFGYQVNDAEIDFLCDTTEGKVVLETKVHRTDVAPRQLAKTLRQDVIKLGNKLQALLLRGVKVKESYLVVNFGTSPVQDMVKEVLSDLTVKQVLSQAPGDVKIIGPPEVKPALSAIGLIKSN